MSKYKTLAAFFLAFIVIVFLLKMFRIIHIPNEEILSFLFIFVGFGAVYISFGKNNKGILFLGTTLFLIGIILFAKGNYEISNPSRIMLTATLFILGAGFLIVYIDDNSTKLFLPLSIILFILAGAAVIFTGEISFQSFVLSIPGILVDYWPLFILMLGIVLILSKEH